MAPGLPATETHCLAPPLAPNRGVAVTVAAAAVAVAATAAAAVSLTVAGKPSGRPRPQPDPSAPLWASLSLGRDVGHTSVVVPAKAAGVGCLAGVKLQIGLPKKNMFKLMSVFKLMSMDIYAFGVCADADALEEQLRKYQKLKESAELINDTLNSDSDTTMKFMLQKVSGRLSINEILSEIEKRMGGSLKGFLLQSFVSLSYDEHKLRKGSVIELYMKSGHVLKISIDGEEVWSSKLLWKYILDPYVGYNSLVKYAKEHMKERIARALKGDEWY